MRNFTVYLAFSLVALLPALGAESAPNTLSSEEVSAGWGVTIANRYEPLEHAPTGAAVLMRLEGDAPDLPLALSLETRRPLVGKPGAALRRLRCDLAVGDHCAPAMPLAKLSDWFSRADGAGWRDRRRLFGR